MTNPLKHLLGRCSNQNRLAADSVDLLDPLFPFDDLKDVAGPRGIGWQPQEAHQRGPRLLALVSQQNRPSRGPVGVKILRHRQQMTDRMFPAWQSDSPLVTGGMFAERHVFCRAVGEGQVEGGLLMNCRRNCADI